MYTYIRNWSGQTLLSVSSQITKIWHLILFTAMCDAVQLNYGPF